MRPILLLLCCFCLTIPRTESFDFPLSGIVSSFAKELDFGNDTARVIRHPSAPFVHEGMLYYWKGYYQGAPSSPRRCVFTADKTEWPFGNVTFINGSSPHGVEFGCRSESTCNKLRCSQPISPSFFWGLMLLVSAIIAVAVYVRYWISRRDRERMEPDIELRSVYVPVVLPGRADNSGGPPYRPL